MTYIFDKKLGRMVELSRSPHPTNAPAFIGIAKDESAADQAIPRALKQLEQTCGADRIARDAGFSVNTLKRTWKI
jgi:hypothetical protein